MAKYTDEELKLAREFVLDQDKYKTTEFMNANDKKKKRLVKELSQFGKEDQDYKILYGDPPESTVIKFAEYRRNKLAKKKAELEERNKKNSVDAWREGKAEVRAVMGDSYNEVDENYYKSKRKGGGGNKNSTPTKPATIPPQKYDVEGSDKIDTIEKNILEEYGNNYFELITYDNGLNGGKDGGKLKLAGVLKDIPSFSMSCSWDKGPASSISDTVKGFMCSPLMEMVTTIGGHDRAWMSLDEGTDRTYKTTTRPTFDLSFKIYTIDNIGSKSLTTWNTWLKALSLYAMPSVDAKVSINAMGNNAINGVIGCFDQVNNTFQAAKDAFTGAGDDKDLIDKLATTVVSAVNSTFNSISNRDGPYRVISTANTKNFYGAKLWYLRILPGIFENPLIVYISNWGITYSKEMNIATNEPIWVEFKVTCEMDQVASAPVWMKYISSNTSHGYINSTYMTEIGKARNDYKFELPEYKID